MEVNKKVNCVDLIELWKMNNSNLKDQNKIKKMKRKYKYEPNFIFCLTIISFFFIVLC